VLLAACKTAPEPAPIENRTAAPPPGACIVQGHVHDAKTNEPVAGVTLVLGERENAISDEHGAFKIAMAGTPTVLDVYYLDFSWKRRIDCGSTIELRMLLEPPGPALL